MFKIILFLSITMSMSYAEIVDKFISLGAGQISYEKATSTTTTAGTTAHIKSGVTQEVSGYGVEFEYAYAIDPLIIASIEYEYQAMALFLTYKIPLIKALHTKLRFGYMKQTLEVSSVTAKESSSAYGISLCLDLFSGLELYADYTDTAVDDELILISAGLNYHF